MSLRLILLSQTHIRSQRKRKLIRVLNRLSEISLKEKENQRVQEESYNVNE